MNGAMGRKMSGMFSRIDEKVKTEASSETVTPARQKELAVKVFATAVGLLLLIMFLLLVGWLLLFS
jgi:hypothetical protein